MESSKEAAFAAADPYEFSEDFEEPAARSSSSAAAAAPVPAPLDVAKQLTSGMSVSQGETAGSSSPKSDDVKEDKKVPASEVPLLKTESEKPVRDEVVGAGEEVSQAVSGVPEASAKVADVVRVTASGKGLSLPALDILKRNERDSDGGSSPVGSPLTPDSGDNTATVRSTRDGSPSTRSRTSKSRRSRANSPATEGSASKRRQTGAESGPGSPQTVVSERRQLALLRQQARDNEKQMSPDTSFSKEGPSTPSSSSSSKEVKSAFRRDGKGETSLHVACKKGDVTAVKKLLDDGADVNATDNAGWTPLHEAANYGHEEVTRLLIKSGADLNVKGMEGVTPLMDAVRNDHVTTAKLLLKSGADPSVENDKGQTCLDIAEERQISADIFPSESFTSPSTNRKRKRETASTEKEKDPKEPKDTKDPKDPKETKDTKDSKDTKETKETGGMAARTVGAVTGKTSAVVEKVKDVTESQYEDISEDEEDAGAVLPVTAPVPPVPAVAAVPLVSLVPAVPSVPAVSEVVSGIVVPLAESVHQVASALPENVTSSLSVPLTESVTMSTVKLLPVPKLRPPSPTPPTITAAISESDKQTRQLSDSDKQAKQLSEETVSASGTGVSTEKSTDLKESVEKDQVPEREAEEKSTSPVVSVPLVSVPVVSVPVVSVPVHEASDMPSTDPLPVSEVTLSPEKSPTPPPVTVVPPPTALTEVAAAPSLVVAAPSQVVVAAPSPVSDSLTPAVTESAQSAVVASSEVELPPVHSVTTIPTVEAPLATAPHAPTLTSSSQTPTSILVQPSSSQTPVLSVKIPSVLPIVPGGATTVVVVPAVLLPTTVAVAAATATISPVKSAVSAEKKTEKGREKGRAQSFLPQGPPPPQERGIVSLKRSLKEGGGSGAAAAAGGEESGEKETVLQRTDETSVVTSVVTSGAGLTEVDAGAGKSKVAVGESSGKVAEPSTSQPKKLKEEKPAKPMTRAQRAHAAQAAALSAGGAGGSGGRRRKEKDEKQPRGRPSKRAAADADIQSGEDAGGVDVKKRPSARLSPKKVKSKDEGSPVKSVVEQAKSPLEVLTQSPPRLPFKKRLGIRNEIEEFINQRRQVEENWKRYTNNFTMKIFPKHCNDYRIMQTNYSIEATLPKKMEAPLALPAALKDFFNEQAEERGKLMRAHIIERNRLTMGAEEETMRLHQRFSRIQAGITVPYSACMIISEQDSNRSFQNQEQEDKTRNVSRNRTTPRDLIKWLEESDDKFDYAKKELLTRHRLEAAMLRSKQRLDWAWKASDLNLVDPSCRNPEELPNLYVPEVVVEDFALLLD